MICRGRNKYVGKLHEENGASIHYEEMATGSGTAKPVATKQKGQSNPPPPAFSKMYVPVGQRKWNDTPAVDYVNQRSLSYRVSKTMTQIPRYHGPHREDDGTSCWNTLLLMLCATTKTRTPGNGRIRNGWIFSIKEVTRTEFSIA